MNYDKIKEFAHDFDKVSTGHMKEFLIRMDLEAYKMRQLELANALLVTYIQTMWNTGEVEKLKKSYTKLMRCSKNRKDKFVINTDELVELIKEKE